MLSAGALSSCRKPKSTDKTQTVAWKFNVLGLAVQAFWCQQRLRVFLCLWPLVHRFGHAQAEASGNPGVITGGKYLAANRRLVHHQRVNHGPNRCTVSTALRSDFATASEYMGVETAPNTRFRGTCHRIAANKKCESKCVFRNNMMLVLWITCYRCRTLLWLLG